MKPIALLMTTVLVTPFLAHIVPALEPAEDAPAQVIDLLAAPGVDTHEDSIVPVDANPAATPVFVTASGPSLLSQTGGNTSDGSIRDDDAASAPATSDQAQGDGIDPVENSGDSAAPSVVEPSQERGAETHEPRDPGAEPSENASDQGEPKSDGEDSESETEALRDLPAGYEVVTAALKTDPFYVAGVTWTGASPDRVDLRVLESGQWTDWFTVEIDAGNGGMDGTEPFITSGAAGIQVRLVGTIVPSSLDLALTSGGSEEAKEVTPDEADIQPEEGTESDAIVNASVDEVPFPVGDVYAVEASTTSGTSASVSLAAALPAPRVISRSGWGNERVPQLWKPSYLPTKGAIIHHTATTNTYTAAQAPGIVRSIHDYHTYDWGRGWDDIGYNFLIDKFGNVYEGRYGTLISAPGTIVTGGHAAPVNQSSVGISVIGTYTGSVTPTATVLTKIEEVVAWQFSLAGVSATGTRSYTDNSGVTRWIPTIAGHRDVSATTCPGNIYSQLGRIRMNVDQKLKATSPRALPPGSPIGQWETLTPGTGTLTVTGWAIEPETTGVVYVWMTIDGKGSHIRTGQRHAGAASQYPYYGSNTGFSVTKAATPGDHRVCLTINNVGSGAHTSLGCRTITVNQSPPLPAGSPIGQWESVTGSPGSIHIKGWAIEPEVRTHTYLWVTVDGVGRHIRTGVSRADVGRAYPYYGNNKGFDSAIGAEPGSHRVCLTINNVGAGKHASLGCRTVVVPDYPPLPAGSPIGNWESVTGGVGYIEVKGWAIEPENRDVAYIWVTVDGAGRHIRTGETRADVKRSYPYYGDNKGFRSRIPVSAGTHRVCLTINNQGVGSHKSMSCRTVISQ